MMRTKMVVGLLCALLAVGSLALAADRPHQGKIVSIDKDLMTMKVQSEHKEDQWTLYWTQTTKLSGDVIIEELNVGDKINFDYTEKDGKMWVTRIDRTDKGQKSEHDD